MKFRIFRNVSEPAIVNTDLDKVVDFTCYNNVRSYCLNAFILLLIIISLGGCFGRKGSSEKIEMVTITDMLGRRVNVPKKVEKIVGVRASALRLLVYMDVVNMVSGIEDVELRPGRSYAMAHPKLIKLPVIGPMMGGDAELLVVNNPDVIFMTYTTIGEADDLHKKTGIPVVAIIPGDLAGNRQLFDESLQLIGKIVNREERADSIITFIDYQEELLRNIASQSRKHLSQTVYLGGVSYSGTRGITSTNPSYEAFKFVNAQNVASGLENAVYSNTVTGTTVDIEQLIVWNPDHLFIDASGLPLVNSQITPDSPGVKSLNAFKNNQVHTLMPYNWYATNFETIYINAWFIASILYPDVVSEEQFRNQSYGIYSFFLGKDVTSEMEAMYDGWIRNYKAVVY